MESGPKGPVVGHPGWTLKQSRVKTLEAFHADCTGEIFTTKTRNQGLPRLLARCSGRGSARSYYSPWYKDFIGDHY